MKQIKGLDFWTKSSIWLELIIPGYFFGKTFGTSDAKYRFLDSFMYPSIFINICGYFRDIPVGFYTARFLGVFTGAMLGVFISLLIGLFYKWVLKEWAYAKAARIGSLAFILIALMTGFMSDMFCESIGMGLKIEENVPEELEGKYLIQDYGSFVKGTKITQENIPFLSFYGKVKANNPSSAYRWWVASLIFMFAWFILYFLCAHRLFRRNKVPPDAYLKLQLINLAIVIILLKLGFGISPSEYHYIVTRFQYLYGGI